MKVQYFGDVNYYRKFALLRLLAWEASFKIGVCWMLTPDDGRKDGASRTYVGQADKWRDFDPELYDALKIVPASPTADDFRRIENGRLFPEAAFFGNEPTPDSLTERNRFHHDCMEAFANVELAFFDPDNGLEVASCLKGRKRSSKYVYYDELADHCREGRSVLVYQHFPHKARAEFMQNVADRLGAHLPPSRIWAFETAHVAFMAAAQPHHARRVEATAQLVERQWLPKFFKALERY